MAGINELTGPFSLITLFGFLHHAPGFDTRRSLLIELGRLLEPDGILAFSVLAIRPLREISKEAHSLGYVPRLDWGRDRPIPARAGRSHSVLGRLRSRLIAIAISPTATKRRGWCPPSRWSVSRSLPRTGARMISISTSF